MKETKITTGYNYLFGNSFLDEILSFRKTSYFPRNRSAKHLVLHFFALNYQVFRSKHNVTQNHATIVFCKVKIVLKFDLKY